MFIMGYRFRAQALRRERWNSKTVSRLPNAKAEVRHIPVNQERKLGDRRRLDTAVVLTVNYTNRGSVIHHWSRFPRNCREIESIWVLGGVYSQEWNLKELTEEHHQEWSLRLNSTQHGKTYQVQTIVGMTEQSSFMIFCMVVHGRS